MPVTINGTTGIAGVDGSAGTPAVQGTDTNTGVFYPAADTVGVSTGGSERMRVDSSGNVGIGTSSPQSRVQIVGSAAAAPTGGDGLHLGAAGGYATIEMCGTTGGYIDFSKGNGTDQLGRIIYDNVNNIMSFNTNSTERARIDSSGNLLVGNTTSPNTTRLYAKASTSDGTTRAFYLENSAGSVLFTIFSDGGFNTGTAAFAPYNNTTATAANLNVDSSGSFKRSTSSLRYKINVQDATHGLSDVMKLRSVTYNGKNDGDKVFGGFIAEEVDGAGLSEFVAYDEEGRPDALHYGNMVALMAKAIQELSAKVDAQAAEIAALKANAPA